MENTSCGQNCPFFKQGFCASEKECPNYIETWWVEGDNSTPKLIKDCSPKRMLLQQQVLQTRLEQVSACLCESRNEYNRLATYLQSIVEASKQIINLKEEKYEKIDNSNSNSNLLN